MNDAITTTGGMTGADTTHAGSGPPPRRRLVTAVDLDAPLPDLDLTGMDGALVVVMRGGRPIGRAALTAGELGVGLVPSEALGAALHTRLSWEIWTDELRGHIRRRLGTPWWESVPRRSITVAVCTRDRPAQLAACLEALAHLDPAPDRVLVIDNASEEPCRALVEAHGADYAFEPRPGLDNARNRAIAECTTELIAFTDDDCRPIPRWLAHTSRYFEDPATGAVTGWGCAYRLESGHQIAFEDTGGFARGLRYARHDWLTLDPPDAGHIGAGANMAFRVAVLREVGGFAPELDAGTATSSGGDTYAFGRVIAAGYRIVVDPGAMVWHDHRADMTEFRRVMRGYGHGIGAVAARSLLVDREPAALRVGMWPLTNVLDEARGLLGRRRNTLDVIGGAEQARGALEAPLRWRRSLRAAPAPPSFATPVAAPPAGGGRRRVATDAPELSVVVPTIASRVAELDRCLTALSRQTLDRDRYEVIVVPNGPGAEGVPEHPGADRTIALTTPGPALARNVGAAAARGEVVVFLDDDIYAEPGCLEHHLAAYRADPGRPTLGPAYPPGLGVTLSQQLVNRWWFEHYAIKHRPGHVLSFVDVLTGNLGIGRELYADLGGLDESFGAVRREDYALGCTMLHRGIVPRVLPEAVAIHHHGITPLRMVADRVREGHGDVVLVDRFPEVGWNLPLRTLVEPGSIGGKRWRADIALARAALGLGRPGLEATLAALERTHARRRWGGLLWRLVRAGYRLGVQDALDAGHPPPVLTRRRTVIDLDGGGPIRPSGVALGEVVLRWGGEELGGIHPVDGQWDADHIERELADHVGLPALLTRVRARGS